MNNLIANLGGRKSAMFCLTLLAVFLLSIFNKANSETLGLIDTLYLVYAGSNVATKTVQKKKDEVQL